MGSVVRDRFPVRGTLAAAFRRVESELDRVIRERIEGFGRDVADELGVRPFRRYPTVREAIKAGEHLKNIDLPVDSAVGEMPEQFRSVVRRVGTSPFEFDYYCAFGGVASDIDRRPRDPMFDVPIERRSMLRERVTKPRLDRGGERAHELEGTSSHL